MKIAFIGLGKMGSTLAQCLIKAGYELRVFNRTSSKMQPLIDLGASGAISIAEAVESTDVVFSCLLDDNASIAATDEIAKNVGEKTIHVNLATILPKTSEMLLELHKVNKGKYIAATVFGAPHTAIDKTMTTLCSGEESGVKAVEKLLEVFSAKVMYLGSDIKAANNMKVCMNYSLTTAFELIGEIFVFAEKSGLDKELVKEALHGVYGHNSYKHYIDKIFSRDFDNANFDVIGGHKDVSLFEEAFASVGVVPELANVVRARYISAIANGMEKKDWSCIYDLIRSESGLKD